MSKASDKAAKAAERAKRWEEFRQQSVAAFMAASEQNQKERELKAQKEANKMAKKRTTKAKGKAKRDLSHLKGPRITFDKNSLMFRKNVGTVKDPVWDYSYHWKRVEDKTPSKEVLIRSVKHLNKPSTKSYADFLAFRVDLLEPKYKNFNEQSKANRLKSLQGLFPVGSKVVDEGDVNGYVDLDASIEAVDAELLRMAEELKGYGFKAPEWSLSRRQRGPKTRGPSIRTKAKIKKLSQLSFLTAITE